MFLTCVYLLGHVVYSQKILLVTHLLCIRLGDLADNDISKVRQKTLDDEDRTLLEELPHIFKYHFSCDEKGSCNHYMTCEDWELFQSYRSWRWIYKDKDILWEKLRDRYFDWMIRERNLYFYLGAHSMFSSWMIIGLYYPPK